MYLVIKCGAQLDLWEVPAYPLYALLDVCLSNIQTFS
jgi:hypothetical protein